MSKSHILTLSTARICYVATVFQVTIVVVDNTVNIFLLLNTEQFAILKVFKAKRVNFALFNINQQYRKQNIK